MGAIEEFENQIAGNVERRHQEQEPQEQRRLIAFQQSEQEDADLQRALQLSLMEAEAQKQRGLNITISPPDEPDPFEHFDSVDPFDEGRGGEENGNDVTGDHGNDAKFGIPPPPDGFQALPSASYQKQ